MVVEGNGDAYSSSYGAGSLVVTATQQASTTTLTVLGAGTGAGTVSSQPGLSPTIACGLAGSATTGACQRTYPVAGTSVTLTAAPSPGATFSGWLNCPASNGSQCTIVMNAPRLVGAGFTADPPTVTSLTPTTGPVGGGTTVTLTGTNFLAGGTTVTVGGVATPSVTVTNTGALVAVTPPGAAGAHQVVVTTPAGAAPSATSFTYAGGCVYSVVSHGSDRLPAAGGTFNVSISTAPSCTWGASTAASWITASGAASGTADGSVTFTVAANAGSVRSGVVNVAGTIIHVGQEGTALDATWTYSLVGSGQPVLDRKPRDER